MRNELNLPSRVADSFESALETAIHAFQSTPRALKVVAAVGAGAAAFSPADAAADEATVLKHHALQVEKKDSVYRQMYPNDVVDLDFRELARAKKLRQQGYDIHSAYLLARGDNTQKIVLSTGEVVGNRPQPIFVNQGQSIDDGILNWMNTNDIRSHPLIVRANRQQKSAFVNAARAKAKQLNLNYTTAQSHTSYKLMDHEVLAAGLKAMLNVKVQPAQPTAPTVPRQPTAPVAPPAPTGKPTPVYTGRKTQPPAAPVAPVAPATQPAAKADPCADSELEKIADNYKARIEDHDPTDQVKKDAREAYTDFAKKCPNQAKKVQTALSTLDTDINKYAALEAERIRFALLNVGGGGFAGKSGLRGGQGMLNLGWSRPKGAKNMFNVSLYADGGGWKGALEGTADEYTWGMNQKQGFGGFVFNLGEDVRGTKATREQEKVHGRIYNIELSFGGIWTAHDSASSKPRTSFPDEVSNETVPVTMNNQTINKQVKTTTSKSEEVSKTSESDGYQPAWFLTLGGDTRLGEKANNYLRGQFGIGQTNANVKSQDTTRTEERVTEDVHTPGTPYIDETTKTGKDTLTTDEKTSNDDTWNWGLYLEYLRQFNWGKKTQHKLDVGLNFSLLGSDTEGGSSTTRNKTETTLPTTGSFTVQGQSPVDFPEQPGSTDQKEPEDLAKESRDGYQLRGVVGLSVLYDWNDKLALRVQPGLVFPADGGAWNDMPVSGNVTLLYKAVERFTFGGQAICHDNKCGGDLLLSTGDFREFDNHVRERNHLMLRNLMHTPLMERYVTNQFLNFAETNNGLTAIAGFRIDSNGEASGRGSLAYVHQFNKGWFGASVLGDYAASISARMALVQGSKDDISRTSSLAGKPAAACWTLSTI
jgi:hypothetical protein